MFNHAPEEYFCPFCALVRGIQGDNLYQSSPMKEVVPLEQRKVYADKLRAYLHV